MIFLRLYSGESNTIAPPRLRVKRGNDPLVISLPENGTSNPNEVTAFFDSNAVIATHAHGKGVYVQAVMSGEIGFYFVK